MCEKVDQLVKQQVEQTRLLDLFGYVQRGSMKLTPAAREAGLSLKEFKEQMKLQGFSVPQKAAAK